MGRDLQGWIEVKDWYKDKWDGVVKIGFPLRQGGRNYAMEDHFFFGKDAIVGCRGLPEILSPEVEAEREDIANSFFSCKSWLNWSEMILIDWTIIAGEWQLLYDLMEILTKSHGEENVRMVI